MLRVSVSDVDAYRYWCASEDADLPGLLARLRREEPPTELMAAGSALHRALELAADGDYSVLEADGYRFTLDLDCELPLPAIRELKATKDYIIDGVAVTLVGKVDALQGLTVVDHKTTSRFDAEKFMDSFQWRAYLDIFEADHFRWNVFEMAELPEPRCYRVFGFHPLDQFRYPALRSDVVRELRRFVGFARAHLPERFTFQEAA